MKNTVVEVNKLRKVYGNFVAVDDISFKIDKGKILALGTVDELKASQNEKVQQFFNRQPDPEEVDRDEHLSSLIGNNKNM